MRKVANMVNARFLAVASFAFIALLAAGCDSLSTTADEIVVAAIDVVVDPDTVTAEATIDGDFRWIVSFMLRITETAGVGATINSVNATVVEAAGGIEVVSTEPEVFQVRVDSATNRVEANGSVDVGFEILYALPGDGSEAIVNVALSVIDDNGLEVGGDIQVLVE